jgi:Uma2 family endonuclease
MSVAVTHPDPYTVDALYALPEDGMRHELLDGTLLVSPPPTVGHQLAAHRLVLILAEAAPEDVEVLETLGVAVPTGLLVPDVVVAKAAATHSAARHLEASDVLGVIEVVSPSSRTADRSWKPEAYAEAGIGMYWRVELGDPGGAEIVVLTLAGGRWEEVARVTAGAGPVRLPVPFPVEVDAATLTRPPPQ